MIIVQKEQPCLLARKFAILSRTLPHRNPGGGLIGWAVVKYDQTAHIKLLVTCGTHFEVGASPVDFALHQSVGWRRAAQ